MLEFDALILDVDGVLFQGKREIPGVADALHKLVERQIQLAFVTNNVTRTKEEIVQGIQGLIPNSPVLLVDPLDVLETTLLVENPNSVHSCFIIGTPVLPVRLSKLGILPVNFDSLPEASGVFVGSTMDFDYNILTAVTTAIKRGAILCASGRESVFFWDGKLWPGVGAIVAAIEVASGSQAIILGKPSPYIFQAAAKNFSKKSRVVVVGDDLVTDIQGAKQAGFQSVLVMSGVTSREEAERARIKPDLVVSDLKAFVLQSI